MSYRDGGQQSFWDVGDDDTYEKDNRIQPVVAEDESDDEKSHT